MALEIGFLVFPKVQQLDLTGPYEVLASLPGASMHLVGKTLDPVMSSTRLVLLPTVTMAACPQLDILCVPGGAGINQLLIDRFRDAEAAGRVLAVDGNEVELPVADQRR